MPENDDRSTVMRESQVQILRLVAKGFYNELINYGLSGTDVLTVAGHLLDNLNRKTAYDRQNTEYYNQLFTVRDVRNEWDAARRLSLHDVSIAPTHLDAVPRVVTWLRNPAIRDSFYPPYPDSEQSFTGYFQTIGRDYFTISYRQEEIGIIGAEHMDPEALKLEMRKLVGDAAMRGKGIGKRATMLFLYHVFLIRRFKKVYVNSLDINVRNLNLNAKFGFELEGTLFEDALVQNKRRDVVRMGLSVERWLTLFS